MALGKIDIDNLHFLLYNFCLEDWAKYEITIIMDEPPYWCVKRKGVYSEPRKHRRLISPVKQFYKLINNQSFRKIWVNI